MQPLPNFLNAASQTCHKVAAGLRRAEPILMPKHTYTKQHLDVERDLGNASILAPITAVGIPAVVGGAAKLTEGAEVAFLENTLAIMHNMPGGPLGMFGVCALAGPALYAAGRFAEVGLDAAGSALGTAAEHTQQIWDLCDTLQRPMAGINDASFNL